MVGSKIKFSTGRTVPKLKKPGREKRKAKKAKEGMKSLEEKDARSGPVAAAGLDICGPLQGAGGGFFTAAGATDIDSLQIGFLADFRVQKEFFELEPAGADEFGFEHRPLFTRVRTRLHIFPAASWGRPCVFPNSRQSGW